MSDVLSILANLLPLAAMIASITLVARIMRQRTAHRPLLPMESRRPVPWNFVAPAILLAPTVTTLLLAGGADVGGAVVTPKLDPVEAVALTAAAASDVASGMPAQIVAGSALRIATVERWTQSRDLVVEATDIWLQALAFVTLSLATGVVLSVSCGATKQDLGLPQNWAQFCRDARTGAAAFLAVLLPVYAIQLMLTELLAPTEGHPLIEQLELHHSAGMMIAAAAAAAVAAPIFEETAFRLVLQGWLERLEDRRLRITEAASCQTVAGVLPGLVRGWTPILVSGTVFSAAHLGHGVAPVSLLPLGWTLGYLYQRTHRLAPSIVCHALFNSFSLIMLWLALASGGE